MPRVKRGTIANKSRKNTLKAVKGYRFGRSTKERMAYDAIAHAGTYAFAHRKDKKHVARANWNIHISGALKESGLSYSKFIGALKKANITLDRKILSDIAANNPDTFKRLVEKVK
jgi:large subunit ribosomal protein L20